MVCVAFLIAFGGEIGVEALVGCGLMGVCVSGRLVVLWFVLVFAGVVWL